MESMTRTSCAVIVLTSLAVLLVPSSAFSDGRPDSTLAWDDGERDTYLLFSYSLVRSAAVRFEAPEWATYLTRAAAFVGGACTQDLPCPFGLSVLSGSGSWPYGPGEPAATANCLADTVPDRIEVLFPEPVAIGDGVQFPDRVFFVDFVWSEAVLPSPTLGVDTDDPLDGQSWVRDRFGDWQLYYQGDIMLRATVSDTTGTAVELTTWGSIKSPYWEASDRQASARPN
jgi:hypothetical protein